LQVVYQWIVRIVFWVLLLAATNSWLTFCLRQFPYTAPVGAGAILVCDAASVGAGRGVALPGVLVAVIIPGGHALLTNWCACSSVMSATGGSPSVGWIPTAPARQADRDIHHVGVCVGDDLPLFAGQRL